MPTTVLVELLTPAASWCGIRWWCLYHVEAGCARNHAAESGEVVEVEAVL